MIAPAARKPYQGVLQILRFNWPQYAGAAIVIAGAFLLLPYVSSLWRTALLLALVPAAFWLLTSLLVSHYVYDRYPLYELQWIEQTLGKAPASWVNIHCGFDETSGLLSAVFPQAAGSVVDVYDPVIMTEGSIARAQRLNRTAPDTVTARYDALGYEAGKFDAAFLIFAAHELRLPQQRVALLQEVNRLLGPDGQLLLVEHTRDPWNFLAFGPGFLHFFSPKSWREVIAEAGLVIHKSFRMTPFVTVYQAGKRV